MPEAEDVEFVRLSHENDSYVYRQDEYMLLQAETPEAIGKIRRIHGTLLTENHDKTDGVSKVELLYRLKNGREVRRYYSIDEHTAVYDELRLYFSSPQYIFNTDRWEELVGGVEVIDVGLGDYFAKDSYGTSGITDKEQMKALLSAIRADCEAGTMAQANTFHVDEEQAAWLYLQYDWLVSYKNSAVAYTEAPFCHLTVYPSNVHTIACLEEILAEQE